MQRSIIEQEVKRRIDIAVWAYAYEVMDAPLVDDSVFDLECMFVDLTVRTGNVVMDTFFEQEFNPSTGLWILKHPNIEGVKRIYKIKLDSHKNSY